MCACRYDGCVISGRRPNNVKDDAGRVLFVLPVSGIRACELRSDRGYFGSGSNHVDMFSLRHIGIFLIGLLYNLID